MLKYDPDANQSEYVRVTVLDADRYMMYALRDKLEEAGIIAYSSMRMMVMYPNFNSCEAPQVVYIEKKQKDRAIKILNRFGYCTNEDKS